MTMTNYYLADTAPHWREFDTLIAIRLFWQALQEMTWNPRVWAQDKGLAVDLPSAWWIVTTRNRWAIKEGDLY